MSGATNLELARRDARLPGLAFVLDADRVESHLRSQGAIGSSEHIELDYIRYKPGRRALSLMRAVDAEGRGRPLVITACDRAGWAKLNSRGRVHQPAQATGMTLAQEMCVIDWFPFDRRLPQAAKLFDPSRTATILKRTIGKQPGTRWVLDTQAYKPHRRLVVKASSESTVLALKCYTPRDYPAACAKIMQVASAKIDGSQPLILGTSERYSLIASQWVEGEVLSGDLADDGLWKDQLPQAGQLLAKWHIEAQQSLNSFIHKHPGFARDSLLQLTDDIAWLIPELKESLVQILSKIDPHLSTLSEANSIIHGDFYAKQIIVHGDQFQLIDFDEVGRGHRYQDLGNFIGKLYWNSVRSSVGLHHIGVAIETFLASYQRFAGPLDWPVLQTCVVAGILRCLPHAFRRGLSGWQDKMQHMFHLALDWCPDTSVTRKPVSESNLRKLDHPECTPYLDLENINQQWRVGEDLASNLEHTLVIDAQLLRHRPGRRVVVQYTLQSVGGQTSQVMGKARITKPIDQKILQLHQSLQHLAGSGVSVPQVLGKLPELNLWLQEKALGEMVTPESAGKYHRMVGQALAKLHGVEATGPATTLRRSHSVENEIAILSQQFQQWLAPNPQFAAKCQQLLSNCFLLSEELIPVETTLIHRDFYFEQALCSHEHVTLLDFDLAAIGPPELDVGNYLAHLDEYGLRQPDVQSLCHEAGEAFLAGYRDQRALLVHSNVEIWRSLSLARLIAVSQRIPERAFHTGTLLDHVMNLCKVDFR